MSEPDLEYIIDYLLQFDSAWLFDYSLLPSEIADMIRDVAISGISQPPIDISATINKHGELLRQQAIEYDGS